MVSLSPLTCCRWLCSLFLTGRRHQAVRLLQYNVFCFRSEKGKKKIAEIIVFVSFGLFLNEVGVGAKLLKPYKNIDFGNFFLPFFD